MTAIIDQDIATFEGEEGDQNIAPIKLCDAHHNYMIDLMEKEGLTNYIEISHSLFSLAARTVGTNVLCEFKCPICAFKKFNFIEAMVGVYAEKAREAPQKKVLLS